MIDWAAVMSRIAGGVIVDLDGAAPGKAPGIFDAGSRPPSAVLWRQSDAGVARIGVRVDKPLADPAAAAVRLAGAALERGVVPIILSTIPVSGFERFGFQVERLPDAGDAARVAAEAELTNLWNLALIIDATEIEALR
jgi:hypothetical protein